MHSIDEANFEKYEGEYECDLTQEDKEYLQRQYGPTWRITMNIRPDTNIDQYLEFLDGELDRLNKIKVKYEDELFTYIGDKQIIHNSIKETKKEIEIYVSVRNMYLTYLNHRNR